jgi:hypothetical protein
MKNCCLTSLLIALVFSIAAFIVPGIVLAEGLSKAPTGSRSGLQQRIDFGNAHIMGQSIKSGAVYLMHRKKSDIDSMLKVRQDYRDEILMEYGLYDTELAKSPSSVDQSKK